MTEVSFIVLTLGLESKSPMAVITFIRLYTVSSTSLNVKHMIASVFLVDLKKKKFPIEKYID